MKRDSPLLIFLMCFIPRFIYLLAYRPGPFPSGYYWRLSEGLLRYGTLSLEGRKTTAFEPLYPLFLALFRWITRDQFFMVLIFQLIVASIGSIYLYKLGFLLSKDKGVACISALLFSCYPYLIRQSVAVIDVTLLTTLLISATYYYCKTTDTKSTVCCGVVLGLSILTRVVALPIWFLGTLAFFLKKEFTKGLVLFISTPFFHFFLEIINSTVQSYPLEAA